MWYKEVERNSITCCQLILKSVFRLASRCMRQNNVFLLSSNLLVKPHIKICCHSRQEKVDGGKLDFCYSKITNGLLRTTDKTPVFFLLTFFSQAKNKSWFLIKQNTMSKYFFRLEFCLLFSKKVLVLNRVVVLKTNFFIMLYQISKCKWIRFLIYVYMWFYILALFPVVSTQFDSNQGTLFKICWQRT